MPQLISDLGEKVIPWVTQSNQLKATFSRSDSEL